MKREEHINESGLSRLWRHNEAHDCGAMTAFRKTEGCGEEGEKEYSKKENQQRNKSLAAKLKVKGYGLTKLQGVYPEAGKSVKETSFFVVDLKDSGKLEKDMRKLGEEFGQDSVLIAPKGSMSTQSEGTQPKAYLIGTNRCENNWLGYGKKEVFNKGKIGFDSAIYTSKVNGRPFLFEGVGAGIPTPQTGFGSWSMHVIANKDWRELEV
jgi:hypothetical protein